MSRTPNDDRSDSMNPNNDAYYSSRGIDRDDDDYGGSNYGSSYTPYVPRFEYVPCPVVKRFFYDIVELNGRAHHFEMTARAHHSVLDCEDVAQNWFWEIRRRLLPVPGGGGRPLLALEVARDASSGRELSWIGSEYKPARDLPWPEDCPEHRDVIAKQDRLWARKGRRVANRVRAQWETLERFDLGECKEGEMQIGGAGHSRLRAAYERFVAQSPLLRRKPSQGLPTFFPRQPYVSRV